MNQIKRQWKWMLAAAAFLVVIILAGLFFRSYFQEKVSSERTNQLSELASQVGENFENSLDASWDFVATAKNLAERYIYTERSDIVAMADWLNRMTDLEEKEGFFLLLDDIGRYYDASGEHGVWTDFDQVGTNEQSTFIADSAAYDGYYWAFVQKLDKKMEVTDDSASVSYVVLMRSVSSMESSFANIAYREEGETYILKENGTRMYDNLSSSDTLQAYNIFSELRETESVYGASFSELEQELASNGSASSNCLYNGTEYCYSLCQIGEYNIVLLFWLPANVVATSTLEMTSSMIQTLIVCAVLLILILAGTIYAFSKARGRAKLLEQQTHFNAELLKTNQSLAAAEKVTKQALAVAQSANRAKSSFLSNMSHDIRTPLNAILGYQKLIDTSASDPEKVKEYSGKIDLAGRHLLALINDILDMSRIESGKTTLNAEPFDLDTLVNELTTLMAPQAADRKQTFEVKNTVGSLFIVGDRARINQIMTNLLSNAFKYTPDGGKIEFAIERLSSSGRQTALIRFTVRDNGIGMGEEYQKRIFEPFSREENTLVNGISGTGLGMSITKNLVDLMGGIIMVESRQGKGSTFTVELSFRLAQEGEKTETSASSDHLKEALHGKHFLLAEDNDVNAEIFIELLHLEEASCDLAHNGEEAVKLFEASEPGTYDAILMDVQMPVMNGYEATRRIRQGAHPEAETIPIAALTANAFAEDVQQALEAGMNTHIAKPVDMNKLREFIASI